MDLRPIVQLWEQLIVRCRDDKEEKFARTARRAWDFIGKGYMDLYENPSLPDEYRPFRHGGGPVFKARLNLSQQFLSLYLPHVQFRAPERTVTPSRQQPPPELYAMITGQTISPGQPLPAGPTQQEDTARAFLMQWFLNYLSGEYNLRLEASLGCQEALVKGRGVIWHEFTDGYYGMVPGSFYDSVDGLLIDYNARTLRTADYIIHVRRSNREALAAAHQLSPQRIKSAGGAQHDGYPFTLDTEDQQTPAFADGFDDDDTMTTYFEVYSRYGIGPRYAQENEEMRTIRRELGSLAEEPCWLVIVPGVWFPLNLPPELFEVGVTESDLRSRLEWPIPYHVDAADPWPMSALDYQPHTKDAWATSPLEAGLPIQVFLDQSYSFLMDRLATTSRNIIFVSKELENLVHQAIKFGMDRCVVPIDGEARRKIEEFVHVLEFPQVNKDVYVLIQMLQREFEKITGQDPLLFGNVGPTQPRSSAEMEIRDARASTRPDDYAEKTEEWHKRIARKEGIASRLYVGPEIVSQVFGEQVQQTPNGEMYGPMTQLWSSLVNTPDPVRATAELSYSIEVESARKKNKQKLFQNVQTLGTAIAGPSLQLYQQTGIPKPFNAYLRILGDALDQRLDDMMLPDLSAQLQQNQQAAGGQQQAEQEAAAAGQQQAEQEAAAAQQQGKLELEAAKVESQRIKIEMEQMRIAMERAKLETEQVKLAGEQAKLEMEHAKLRTQRARTQTERAKATSQKAKTES